MKTLNQLITLNVYFDKISDYVGNDKMKFVLPYGSLWKSRGSVIYVLPIRKNPGFAKWLKDTCSFISDVQLAGNNIYRVVFDKNTVSKLKVNK